MRVQEIRIDYANKDWSSNYARLVWSEGFIEKVTDFEGDRGDVAFSRIDVNLFEGHDKNGLSTLRFFPNTRSGISYYPYGDSSFTYTVVDEEVPL